jgi:hypothetical protein
MDEPTYEEYSKAIRKAEAARGRILTLSELYAVRAEVRRVWRSKQAGR